MRIVWIIKLERSRRTAAIVAVRAPAVHGVSSKYELTLGHRKDSFGTASPLPPTRADLAYSNLVCFGLLKLGLGPKFSPPQAEFF